MTENLWITKLSKVTGGRDWQQALTVTDLSQFLFSKLNESIASLEARHLSDLQSLEAADLGKSHSQALLWPPPLPTKV